MPDLPISGLPQSSLPLQGTELVALVQDGITKQTQIFNTFNFSSGSNIDNLGGVAVRTLYTRNDSISYTPGTTIDFMSGSLDDIWGSRNIPGSFLQNTDFQAKIIHFRSFGAFGTVGGTDFFSAYLMIGNNKLVS